jgi:guanosine-3',5'-bis(diphosphate) 3'-pyrophosphohydrolase
MFGSAPCEETFMNDGNIALILEAAAFAADRHRNQRRKDEQASPYINHPLAIARILATEGKVTDPAILCAALLHDTIEDTETSLEELHDRFGAAVAGIVAEVTDDQSLPRAERKRLQVVKAAGKSESARIVKIADKISNLRDIVEAPPASWSDARKRDYFLWAGDVAAGLRGLNPALDSAFDAAYAEGLESLPA